MKHLPKSQRSAYVGTALEFLGFLILVVHCDRVNTPLRSQSLPRQSHTDWDRSLLHDGGSRRHQNAHLGCRKTISIARVATLDDRCNVSPLIRSGDVRQKSAAYYARRAFGVVVGSPFGGLRGEYVREVHRTLSGCRCHVNERNVKGETPPDHARVRGGGGVLGPVVTRRRKRYL